MFNSTELFLIRESLQRMHDASDKQGTRMMSDRLMGRIDRKRLAMNRWHFTWKRIFYPAMTMVAVTIITLLALR